MDETVRIMRDISTAVNVCGNRIRAITGNNENSKIRIEILELADKIAAMEIATRGVSTEKNNTSAVMLSSTLLASETIIQSMAIKIEEMKWRCIVITAFLSSAIVTITAAFATVLFY